MNGNNNTFAFVAPMYNASATLGRMLHSIVGQSYDNWKLFLIDDVSSEEEQEKQRLIIKNFQSLMIAEGQDPDKIHVNWNSLGRGKCWEMSNVLHGIQQCGDDDIICRIDADDWLIDLDALQVLNAAYNNTQLKPDFVWSAHRWGYSDRNISSHMPNDANPYTHPWVTSHLKTFKKHLLDNVNDENYRAEDGEYIKRTGDQALCLPALYNSKSRLYIPRQLYHYTIDEDGGKVYQTVDAKFQKSEAEFLRKRGYVK